MESFLVLLLGAVIVLSALFTVTRRNPIHAALAMLVSLGGVAAMMLGMRSFFLAAMQVLLYGGAIMVLFVFVIMLLTLRPDELGPEPPQRHKILAAIGALALLFVLMGSLSARSSAHPVVLHEPYQERAIARAEAKGKTPPPWAVEFGSTEYFARFLYTDYAVPFELITVLVMTAVAAVIVLARRPDRASLERTRLTGGQQS